jgi:hypothetical protein
MLRFKKEKGKIKIKINLDFSNELTKKKKNLENLSEKGIRVLRG